MKTQKLAKSVILENEFAVLAGVAQWIGCEPKGRWLDSQSGHMPGLRAGSPVEGTWEAATH